MNSNLPVNNNTGNKANDDQGVKQNTSFSQIPISAGGKESEMISAKPPENIKEVFVEADIPKEVEKAGVQQVTETIELPPDLKNLGITNQASLSVANQVADLPDVKLPIPDKQVLFGLHQDVSSALRWLAEWCIHKLHKAHVMIKVVHGKIRRVRD
jgi:hypothetical protein